MGHVKRMKHTTVEGIPSTRINRRSFFAASSISAADRALVALLYCASILLNECAVATAEGSGDEEDMRGRCWSSTKSRRAAVGFFGYSPPATIALAIASRPLTLLSCSLSRLPVLDLFAGFSGTLRSMDVPFSSSGAMSRAHYALVRKVEAATPQAADQILLAEVQSIRHQLTRSTLTLVSVAGT